MGAAAGYFEAAGKTNFTKMPAVKALLRELDDLIGTESQPFPTTHGTRRMLRAALAYVGQKWANTTDTKRSTSAEQKQTCENPANQKTKKVDQIEQTLSRVTGLQRVEGNTRGRPLLPGVLLDCTEADP